MREKQLQNEQPSWKTISHILWLGNATTTAAALECRRRSFLILILRLLLQLWDHLHLNPAIRRKENQTRQTGSQTDNEIKHFYFWGRGKDLTKSTYNFEERKVTVLPASKQTN